MSSLALTRTAVRAVLAFDEALLLRIRRAEHAWVTPWMKFFTRVGDTKTWVVLGIVLLASGDKGRRHALLILSAALAARALAQVVKIMFARPRPTCGVPGFNLFMKKIDAHSFPSGHAAAAFAGAVALLTSGSTAGLPALAFAACISSSRVYLGAHYPLDVTIGALIGSAVGVATAAIVG